MSISLEVPGKIHLKIIVQTSMVARMLLLSMGWGQFNFLENRAVSQLKVELQFAIKFSYFREFWKSTKVQFIGQKLNFNFCPTHGLTFLSCNSNEVQRERSVPLKKYEKGRNCSI